jgi:hypothetical protein
VVRENCGALIPDGKLARRPHRLDAGFRLEEMGMDQEKEREAFEKWAATISLPLARDRGCYAFDSTLTAWQGWEARAAVEAPLWSPPTLRYQRTRGQTLDEMRADARRPGGIYFHGDALLVWVNEGDFWLKGVTEVTPLPTKD